MIVSAGRVLLVEPSRGLASLFAGRLMAARFDVDHASDGMVALACARACRYDVIVSEVRMARLSGLDLLACLRHDGATRTPFVLMADSPIVRPAIAGSSPVRVLLKPVASERLAREVLEARTRTASSTRMLAASALS